MAKKSSKIKHIHIDKFRGLANVDMDFGDKITLICGKNGTAKSTILGIIAQVFSFSTDYTNNPIEKNNLSKYKTLLGKSYTSIFREHFRFSEEYDLPGGMDVKLSVYDGLERSLKNELTLKLYNSKDRLKSRPVLRGNNDRNITLPVIYLSVNRLTPIVIRNYNVSNNDYIEKNKELALSMINSILLKDNTLIDSTTGDIESLATHDESYDYQSISVGEDNVGQIVKALLSFKKLKEEFQNYSGGILLIDEADAGLFPAAQIEFFKLLRKFSKEYKVQVIMTSHSPILIQEVYEQKDTKSFKTIYLTDTFGSVEVMNDFNWSDIEADINVRTKVISTKLNLPPINIYFEDNECYKFFHALINKRKIIKLLNISHTTLGGDQLLSLRRENIPEFSTKSVIVLDNDKKIPEEYKNFINLPSELPPDQLIFQILFNLSSTDSYWRNNLGFTKKVFDRIRNETINNEFNDIISNFDTIDLATQVENFRNGDKNKHGLIRESFKNFYKNKDIQLIVKNKTKVNPFMFWKNSNKDEASYFENELTMKLKSLLIKGYRVPPSTIDEYFRNI